MAHTVDKRLRWKSLQYGELIRCPSSPSSMPDGLCKGRNGIRHGEPWPRPRALTCRTWLVALPAASHHLPVDVPLITYHLPLRTPTIHPVIKTALKAYLHRLKTSNVRNPSKWLASALSSVSVVNLAFSATCSATNRRKGLQVLAAVRAKYCRQVEMAISLWTLKMGNTALAELYL